MRRAAPNALDKLPHRKADFIEPMDCAPVTKLVARVRNGFVPASRRQVFERIKDVVSPIMPFSNLPDRHTSRWGDELTAEKMKECIWLRPEAVAQIEFLEWTAGDRLRHAKFAGLREDKEPRQVVKEHASEQ